MEINTLDRRPIVNDDYTNSKNEKKVGGPKNLGLCESYEYSSMPSKYVLGMESRLTAKCMLEYGVNNVRGSMFCGTHELHMGDAPTLTKFVGHYNDLNHRKLSARTNSTLPPFTKSWDSVQRWQVL